MRLLLFFFFTCIFITGNIYCQPGTYGVGPDVKWQKRIGGSGEEIAYDILLTADGGCIAAGTSASNDGDVSGHHGNTTVTDGWVVKLDTAGNIQWQKSLGGSGSDMISSIIATPGNGYLCIGTTRSQDGDISGSFGGYDAWVVKLSRDGNIEWSKNYGDAYDNRAYSGIALSDGNFAITGLANDPTQGMVLKIDPLGNVLWQKNFPNDPTRFSNHYYYSQNIIETDDGRLLNSRGWLFNAATGDTTRLRWDLTNRNVTSMKKHNNRIYILVKENFHDQLIDTESINKIGYLEDLSADFSYKPWSYDAGDDNVSYVYSSPQNGLAILPGDSVAIAGCEISYSRGGVSNLGSFYSQGNIKVYDNDSPDSPDEFYSIGVSSSGTEYFCAGSSYNEPDLPARGYEFWIVKLTTVNTIRGNVFLDLNNNNIQDAGEPGLTNIIVTSSKVGQEKSTLSFDGTFSNIADTGTYITSLILPDSFNYTTIPLTHTSVFTSFNKTDTMNFAVHKRADIKDYTASLFSIAPAISNLPVTYKIVYANKGTDTGFNKKIRFIKDSRLALNTATPAYETLSGDTLTWTIDSLMPGNKSAIIVDLTLPSSINSNDTIVSSVLIDSAGDYLPEDNASLLKQVVTDSFAAIGKEEIHAGNITLNDRDNGLVYTIYFQNTGKDSVLSVIIKDTLDSRIDATSFEMLSASHPYQLGISQGKNISWELSQVSLPDSSRNEEQSKGYISYRVSLKNNLQGNDSIYNAASVYFDFAPPVKTNRQLTVTKLLSARWTGVVDSAWENSGNWSTGVVPDRTTAVIIPANTAHDPVINSNVVIYSLSVEPAASVKVKSSFRLEIKGKN